MPAISSTHSKARVARDILAATVALPLILLIIPATLCAALVAYGTDPAWAQYHHGISLIIWSRRLEWPLIAVCMALCVTLIGFTIAGRRRIWFLVALAPVLALFAHRFSPTRVQMRVEENPTFIDAAAAGSTIADDDYVVGLPLGDEWYAYPYSALFRHPVVFSADREKRVILIWSAYANRAVAASITHDLRGRDLEIVSTPANALLIYDSRLGQFINGVTGLTIKGQKPAGFTTMLSTTKTQWGAWKTEHPATKLMTLRPGELSPGPTHPIEPTCPMPPTPLGHPVQMRIALIGSVNPVAIDDTSVSNAPINMTVDNMPVFIYRDASGLRAFDRRLPNDLSPRFSLNSGKKHPGAIFVDADTDSGWSATGKWLDGFKELKNKKLEPIPVEEDVYWGVMKFWYPQLTLQNPG